MNAAGRRPARARARARPRPAPPPAPAGARRQVTELRLCFACRFHCYPHEPACPHCGADLEEAEADYQEKLAEVRRLSAHLEALLDRVEKR